MLHYIAVTGLGYSKQREAGLEIYTFFCSVSKSHVLHLLRVCQIRLFAAARVKRISKTLVLGSGDVLLYPKSLLEQHDSSDGARSTVSGPRSSSSNSIAGASLDAQQRIMVPGGGTKGGSSSETSTSGSSSPVREALSSSAGVASVNDLWTVPTGGRSIAAPALVAALSTSLLTPQLVRRWVMGMTPDCIFINKPSGVSVQVSTVYLNCL